MTLKVFSFYILLAAVLGISVRAAWADPEFRFYGEDIYMQVLEDSVEVVGIYEFRSTFDEHRKWPIFYPYASDKYHGAARTMYVEEIRAEDTTYSLSFKERKTGSAWYLDLPPNSKKKIKVAYRQKLRSNRATYILTTTRAWEDPLVYANFYVTLPSDKTQSVVLSYAPDDTTHNEDGSVTYVIRRENLMPEKDLTVIWSVPEQTRDLTPDDAGSAGGEPEAPEADALEAETQEAEAPEADALEAQAQEAEPGTTNSNHR